MTIKQLKEKLHLPKSLDFTNCNIITIAYRDTYNLTLCLDDLYIVNYGDQVQDGEDCVVEREKFKTLGTALKYCVGYIEKYNLTLCR